MIRFKTIRYKNLLSTGNNWTEINLDTGNSTLIVGENGAGKSTCLDALCFVLFGKPFRRVNKSSLVNSVNDKNFVVEVEFETNGKKYNITRGIKPNIFKIFVDGVLLNQTATVRDYQDNLEKFILKMNYKSFTSIVILGAASFTPFMQLSAADRRSVVEDLLDIQVFSTMNVLVRQRIQENREQLTAVNIHLKSEKDKKKYIEKNLENVTTNNQNKMQILQDRKKELLQEVVVNRETRTKTQEKIEKIVLDEKTKRDALKKHSTMLGLKGQIDNNKNRLSREIQFYTDNDDCPSCKQEIDSVFKKNIIEKKKDTVDECNSGIVKISKEIDSIVTVINEMDRAEREHANNTNIIQTLDNNKTAIEKRIHEVEKEIVSISEENDIQENDRKNLLDVSDNIKKKEKTKQDLTEQKEILDITIKLLKDGGIKSRIIGQYLPVINSKVNHYLKTLDFFVQFNLDENFNESLKARHLDVFSYANFSEGEKTKIDLALIMTWREIAKLRNSVHTNLLILDEIFDSSLDSTGTENLMTILNQLETGTNVFVISHKKDQMIEKFDRTVTFEKHKNFSRIKEIT